MSQSRVLEPITRAWAWFAAGFAKHPNTGEDDPSYRWALLWFRWGLTAAYVVISLLLSSGHQPKWVFATIGYLVVYHIVGHTAHTVVHMRRGRPVTWFWEGTPFFDIVAVSLIMVSTSSLVFPVWSAYLLIIFGASVSRRGSYVLTLTAASVIGYVAAAASHLPQDEHVSGGDVATVAILLAFGGWFSSNRAKLERSLFEGLRESEDRYRSLVETSPDAVTLTDLSGKILICNEQVALLHGYDGVEDLLGRDAIGLIAPEDRQRAAENMRNTLELGSVRNVEYTLLTSDGRRFPADLSASLVVDVEGKPKAFIGVVRDITERKRTEEALEQLSRQNELILNSAGEGIYGLDLEGRTTFVNPAAARMIGWEVEDIIGEPQHDILHHSRPDGSPYPREECLIYAAFKDGSVHYVDSEVFWKKDGTSFPVEYVSTPIRDERGELAGAVVTFRDITERRRAEEAVRDSEEKYRDLVENIHDVIYEVDAGGRITYISPVMEELSGHRLSDVVGRSFTEFVHPDDLPAAQDRFQNGISGNPAPGEYKILSKAGEPMWVHASSQSILEGPRVRGFRGVLTDITERKRAEEALQESEERFRELSGATLDGIVIHVGGRVVEANDQLTDILGYERSELIGAQVMDLVAPESRDDVSRYVRSDRAEPYEAWAMRKDGTVLPVEVCGKSITYNGQPARVAAIRDITERKRAEEALQESETKFRTLADTVAAATFIFQGRRIRYVNSAAEAITGYTREELLAMSFWDVVHPDFRELVRQRGLARQRGEPVSPRYEVKLLTRSGEERWLDVTASVIEFEGEQAVLGTGFDITERKRAEEALQESETKFRTLADTVAAATFIYQGTGMRYVNSGAEALTGYTREELLAMDFWNVIHPDFRDLVRERGLARQQGEPVPPRYEVKLLTKNGEDRWLDVTASVIEFEGEPAVLGTGFDITERKRAEGALRESEEKYRDLVENINEVLYALDIDGRITYVSPAVERLGGYSPSELIGQSFTKFIHPDDLGSLMESFQRTVSGGPEPSEYRVFTKSGEMRWVRTSSRLVFEGDRAIGLRAVMVDISDRKRAEEALGKLSSAVEQAAESILITNTDGVIEYVNPAFEQRTGYSREEVIGKTPRVLKSGKHRGKFYEVLWKAILSGQVFRAEFINKKKNGELYYEERVIAPIRDGQGNITHFVATGRDITDRKRAEETIKHLAYHDALTDLPNRALLKERLTVALAQARREKRVLAVLFLDLDRLKVVNDSVGHAEGDRLLRSVAERLAGLVREGDTVARVGGDEFTLLLSEVAKAEDAADVAERVLEAFRQPWELQGQEFHVTASIGIAMYPNDGDDAETLLRNADTAMYRAKEQGRNNYQLFTAAMNAQIAERLAVENGLRRGLEREEFLVYYQPQIDINSGRIVGTEALVRWQHPKRGLVLPGEFIPVAEDTGLIVPLGEWVLRAACVQNKVWQEAGLPLVRVAVNLSAREFQQRNLAEKVAQVLRETGLGPRYLQLEITESIAMKDVDFTIAVLRELRAMGVEISVDDFGTGYSSLGYLKRFPVDVVKIDQSFVRDLTVDESDAAIAATVIAIAHNLKLKVIAEGVETEEQLAFLKERQCDGMQGYLFSKPVPAEELRKLLAKDKRRSRARVAVESS